ncbi:hypothetical protein IGI04_017675 [Brassica rapa subsp. trilocularis]|uniref:Uncharacterized protein n=1 Tax=Brassica rapa subsp. trilocularis TaxID=1813537 RepID=A0ABQ7MD44_BRACM|nr:hypothetical protein IGI04_017675 [Brassica rapa subsp. trilocularis]
MTSLLSHPHHLQVITRLPLSVRQMTYLGSRLAVDDLPFGRLAVDDLPGSRLVNAETTSKKSRRLPGSSDDFARRLLGSSDDFQTTLQEVQTTFRKSRRLPDDFQMTSRQLTIKEIRVGLESFSLGKKKIQTTSWKSRRLPESPDDFLEVQTTLSEDFQEVQTTSRRLTVRTLYNKNLPNEEKSDIKTYQNAQKNPDDFLEVQTTSWKSRRLPESPDDFLEVQTTSWKSRRLCQKTSKKSRRLPDD